MVRMIATESQQIGLGRHHMLVDTCVDCTSSQKGPAGLRIEIAILAGDEKGKTFHLAPELYGNTIPALAAACGIVEQVSGEVFDSEAWARARKAKAELDFNASDFVGQQVIWEVVGEEQTEGKHKGKTFPRLGTAIWNVFDPEVKDVPKDADSLSILEPPAASAPPAKTTTAPKSNASRNGGHAKPAASTTAPASKPTSKLAGLI